MTPANAPPIYSDETIYSYVARLHIYWSETNHRATAIRWLGKAPINVDQRLPIGISHVAEKAGYSPDYLLQDHTFFPLFAQFVSNPKKLATAMLSNCGNNLANTSHVAQAGIQKLGGSWYCPDCVEQDKRHLGVAYWHLSHQLHGVSSCPVHGIRLVHTDLSTRKFYLPSQRYDAPRLVATTHATRLTEMLLRFHHDCQLNSFECFEDYWGGPAELIQIKNQLKGQNVDMTVLSEAAHNISDSVFGCKLLSDNVIHNLIYQPDYHCHPLKFIFLCYILDDLKSKEKCIDKAESREIARLEADRKRCESLLNAQTYSLREIARRLQRSVNFVKSIACQIGASFQKRTQFITADVEARVIKSARKGKHREAIARHEGLSVGAVELIIQSISGLSAKRKNLRMIERRDEARKAIKKAISEYPNQTRKELKGQHYADYTWLYRHDKAWLYEVLPPAKNHTKL